MQIGRVRFARIERNDHALVWKVHFYILHPWDVCQHRLQFTYTLIAIFTFSGDFDSFQNNVAGALRDSARAKLLAPGARRKDR